MNVSKLNSYLNNTRWLEDYLKKEIPFIYDFVFKGTIYLTGGSIKSLILNEPIKDLDFVILTYEDSNIEQFLKTYNLSYTINKFKGYKVKLDNLVFDIWSTDDLYTALQYNFDGLFFDLHNKKFLTLGFVEAIKNNQLKEINSSNNINDEKIKIKRKEKLEKQLKKLCLFF